MSLTALPDSVRSKVFALVDCNNFYASCERVFRPDLNGRPVAILSNNDGCIIARSAELKALGIPMGEPYFKVKGLIRQHRVHVFSSNYELYGDLSNRVMSCLSEFSPDMEVYSIDEAFLDLTSLAHLDLESYGHEIKRRVLKEIGIPVSVGIGRSKTLAKVASRLAKKGQGVVFLNDEKTETAALETVDIADVWGIGRRYASRCRRSRIFNAKDYRDFLDDQWIRRKFTVVGLRTKLELQGISCIELDDIVPAKKAICSSRTFSRAVSTASDMSEAVANYAMMATEKLRRDGSCTAVIQVSLQRHFSEAYNDWTQASIRLPVHSNDSGEIIEHALACMKLIFREGLSYRKAGILLMDIIPEDEVKADFFDTRDRQQHKALMQVMDQVNGTFGHQVLKPLACGFKNDWAMKRERLSPRYTTRWEELLRLK